MTMTAGVINGSDFLVYVGGTAISYSTSCSLSMTGPGTSTVNHKDSGNWLTKLKKKGASWTISCDGMLALDGAGINLRELYDVLNGNKTVTVKFATSEASNYFFSGSAVITSFSLDAPLEEGGTWSCEFEGLGKPSFDLT